MIDEMRKGKEGRRQKAEDEVMFVDDVDGGQVRWLLHSTALLILDVAAAV